MKERKPRERTEDRLLREIFGDRVQPIDETINESPPDLQTIVSEAVSPILNLLDDPREKLVVSLRFGLEDGRARTLKEVGQDPRINRSSSTVWSIEHRALRVLRELRGPRKPLRDYLE